MTHAPSDRALGLAILLATRSPDKAREIHELLAPLVRADVISLDDAGIAPDPAEDDIEAYDSFLENAHAKADHFLRITGRATIADDSGICVDALGGAPGVRSRRFAQNDTLTGIDLDRANNERLLHELRDVPIDRRSAHYACAAVLHLPDGRRFAALGTCAGLILEEPRGTGGFGYDPLFLQPDLGRSFGELTSDEKHRRSHRARAFRALAAALPVLDQPSHLR